MAGITSDYSIIGIVLAISLAIILLSGLALYLSFRVRETLREEKGRGAKTAKVALLIGLLFLSGGVFYFFASGFNANAGTASTTSTLSSTTGPSSTSHSVPGKSTTSTSSTTTASSSSSAGQSISMNVQCPTSGGSVIAGATFSCTITVYNLGSSGYQGATLVSSNDFAQFALQACSETINGNPGSCTVASSTEVAVGAIDPGTTVLTLTVMAPSAGGQKSCTVTLASPGMTSTVPQSFTIQVTR
jgi:hypothetical protein